MGLSLAANQLLSWQTRRSVSGSSGLRKIKFDTTFPSEQEHPWWDPRRWVSAVGKFWGAFSGWISNIGAWFARTRPIGRIVDWLIDKRDTLWDFDFNTTDAELKQGIQSRNTSLASIWGDLVGTGEAWLVSIVIGAGVSMVVPVIGGGALALLATTNMLSEAAEDLKGKVIAAIQQTVNVFASNAVTNTYIWGRRAIKSLKPGILRNLLGSEKADWILNKWGTEGQPEMSFASRQERELQQIPSEQVRAFQSARRDAWGDTTAEAMVVLADTLDDQLIAHYEAISKSQGQPRAIEIQLDDRNPDEKILLYGTEKNLIPQITGTLAQHQVLANRDVGYVGAMEPEGLQIPEYQRQRLTIVFLSVRRPPWRHPDGTRPTKAEYNIPNPRRNVTWEEIKRACGGEDGYKWGEWVATARLDSRRKMVIRGASERAAIERLEALATLSSDTIRNISVHRIERHSNPNHRKLPTTVYPAYMLGTKLRATANSQRIQTLEGGSYAESRKKILLWPSEAPSNAASIFE